MTDERDPSRVHWMELFFDLIFVALISQLAHGLHDHATTEGLLVFVALFATVWWSWVNLTFAINVTPWRSTRQLALVMLVAMFVVGCLAVAAPEATTDRAWLFAVGNGALRLLLLGLWAAGSRGSGPASWARIVVYNGVTAVLWLVSAALPAPGNYVVWGLVILVEVTMLVASNRTWGQRIMPRMNIQHLTERFGLLVVIALGETVLSAVTTLNENWSPLSAVTAFLGLVVVSLLAWSFFLYGPATMEHGLEQFAAARRYSAIRDVVGFLPFPIVAGIVAVSGTIANAIAHPLDTLPSASTIALVAGIAGFYLSNAVISLRFGRPLPAVLRWAVPAFAMVALIAVVGTVASALVTMACAVGGIAVIVTIAEVNARRHPA